ncbi:MAG: hypothetical protein Q9223_002878 [Gallowayella weberi]
MGMFEDYPAGKSPKSMDRPALERQFYHTSYSINGGRLKNLLDRLLRASNRSMQGQDSRAASADLLNSFHHFFAPTLPHLMALLIHPTGIFPPEDATLLVVDSVSTPFNHAFALSNKQVDDKTSGKKNDVAQWAAGRRWGVMGDLISALRKLAATRNMAIVLTGQTTTKTKLENAAQLQPVMSGTTWDCGINTRILLYRDWLEEIDEKPLHERGEIRSDLRFAAAIKINGVSLDGLKKIVPFTIDIVRSPYTLGPNN